MKREQLGSRLGFIMLSAGCAIGCGNVWKFPWMCGQNGGGSFMLVYPKILPRILPGFLTLGFAPIWRLLPPPIGPGITSPPLHQNHRCP